MRTTVLEDDLGCTGDDAVEFIEAFANEFDVNVDDFNPLKYFDEEGFMINFMAIYRRIKGIKVPKRALLTLYDLERAIITKKLV